MKTLATIKAGIRLFSLLFRYSFFNFDLWLNIFGLVNICYRARYISFLTQLTTLRLAVRPIFLEKILTEKDPSSNDLENSGQQPKCPVLLGRRQTKLPFKAKEDCSRGSTFNLFTVFREFVTRL